MYKECFVCRRFPLSVPPPPRATDQESYFCLQNNVSDPSVVNCSIAEATICNQARARVVGTSIRITSCAGICCTTNKCNVKELFDTPTSPPSTAGPTSTAGQTSTAGPSATTKSGVKQVQPTFLSFLLVFLTVVLKKVDELF